MGRAGEGHPDALKPPQKAGGQGCCWGGCTQLQAQAGAGCTEAACWGLPAVPVPAGMLVPGEAQRNSPCHRRRLRAMAGRAAVRNLMSPATGARSVSPAGDYF